MSTSKALQGYFQFHDRLRGVLTDTKWTFFGVISYDYVLFSNDILILPENVCIAFAKLLSDMGHNALVLLNMERGGPLSLSTPDGFSTFRKLTESLERTRVLYFGAREETPWDRIKVPLESFNRVAPTVAKILSALSKKYDSISPKKIRRRDVDSLSRTISAILGPPSLGRYLILRAKKYIEEQGGGTKFVSGLLSLTRLAEVFLSGVRGFINGVKLYMRNEEYKRALREEQKKVNQIYSKDILSRIFGEESPEFEEGVYVVISDCFSRHYGFFLPALIDEYLNRLENGVLVLGDLPGPEDYDAFAKWLISLPEKYECKVVACVPSAKLPNTDAYVDLMRRLVMEKSLIFDIKSEFFHTLHERESIVVYAWLYEKFGQIEENRRQGEGLIIHHDVYREIDWELLSLKRGRLEKLVSRLLKR
ncbi:MAG: hypothetical protein ACTSXJ_10100 [Candidatus Baldrarchaeia archaeon]